LDYLENLNIIPSLFDGSRNRLKCNGKLRRVTEIFKKNEGAAFAVQDNTTTKNGHTIGNIKCVQVDDSECLAKTDEDKANVFCNYFSVVYVVEKDATFDTLPIKDNLSSMPDTCFEGVDIATRFLKKMLINQTDQRASIEEFYLKIQKS